MGRSRAGHVQEGIPAVMIPIVLTTYNRPIALRRTLESLSKTDLRGHDVRILIEDDGSDKPPEHELLWDIGFDGGWGGNIIRGEAHGGPNRCRRRSLWRAFEREQELHGAPFVITIESDLVFNPNWLFVLLRLYAATKGLNGHPAIYGTRLATISPYRGMAFRSGEVHRDTFTIRDRTGGVCHLITRDWYERGKMMDGWMAWERVTWGEDGVPEWSDGGGGWDHVMGEQARKENMKFACLKPSLVDHVSGPEGGTSGSSLAGDRAMDFVGER